MADFDASRKNDARLVISKDKVIDFVLLHMHVRHELSKLLDREPPEEVPSLQ